MKFIHSVIAQDEVAAVDTYYNWDLPVNPLSHLILTIKCLNVAAVEATKYEIENFIRKLTVLYRGTSIVDLSGVELDTYIAQVFKNLPILGNQVTTINGVRTLALPIPFGRKIFDKDECFPKTSKGELVLQIRTNTAAACPNITGMMLQIESVELPEASPKNYVKITTITKTPTAAGEHDVNLPIGNKFLGVLMHATTVPIGATWTKSIGWVKLLIDNIEYNFSKTNWESLHGMLINKIGHREPYDLDADHDHYMDASLLDFDPLGDDSFLIDSVGKASIKLRINAEIANLILIHPIELVKV